jgi:hypothetical protein
LTWAESLWIPRFFNAEAKNINPESNSAKPFDFKAIKPADYFLESANFLSPSYPFWA